jgi:hypothetical protein
LDINARDSQAGFFSGEMQINLASPFNQLLNLESYYVMDREKKISVESRLIVRS